jgi:hypothetical protein
MADTPKRFEPLNNIELLQKHGWKIEQDSPLRIHHRLYHATLEGSSAEVIVSALRIIEGQPREDRPDRYDRLTKAKGAVDEIRQATYKGEWVLPFQAVAADLRSLRRYIEAMLAEIDEETKLAGDPP